MSKRQIQYADVAKVGLMGAIKVGDFLPGNGESSDSEWTADMYVRQQIALSQMERDGGDGVAFNFLTGKPEEITPDFATATFRCIYKLPVSAEDVEVVVRFCVPEYMQGQACSGAFMGGSNFDSATTSEVTGATAIFFDEACSVTPQWLADPNFGEYFLCPDNLYFKMKAGQGGSTTRYPSEAYSVVELTVQYAAKDSLDIYQ